MRNDFSVTADVQDGMADTNVTWTGGLKMLEYIRDTVIPEAIKHQQDLVQHHLVKNFEYKPL